jgi:HD-like signal output (HDOD) protein
MLVNILEDYHCQLGARLLEKWKFDDCYISTALHHNGADSMAAGSQAQTEAAYGREMTVVQLASQIVNSMGYNILASDPAEIDLDDASPIHELNLQPTRIAETQEQVKQRMKEVQDLF